jgi:hypothetical protein
VSRLIIAYMYRDYSNEKLHQTAILENPDNEPADLAKAHFRDWMEDGGFFVPDRVGLPPAGNHDGELHELEYVEIYEGSQEPVNTLQEFIERLK